MQPPVTLHRYRLTLQPCGGFDFQRQYFYWASDDDDAREQAITQHGIFDVDGLGRLERIRFAGPAASAKSPTRRPGRTTEKPAPSAPDGGPELNDLNEQRPADAHRRQPQPVLSSEPRPLLLDVKAACARLSVSRSFLYGLMERGDLVYTKLGRSRRIAVSDLNRLAASGRTN